MTKTIKCIALYNLSSLLNNEFKLSVSQIYDMQNKSIIILKIQYVVLKINIFPITYENNDVFFPR